MVGWVGVVWVGRMVVLRWQGQAYHVWYTVLSALCRTCCIYDIVYLLPEFQWPQVPFPQERREGLGPWLCIPLPWSRGMGHDHIIFCDLEGWGWCGHDMGQAPTFSERASWLQCWWTNLWSLLPLHLPLQPLQLVSIHNTQYVICCLHIVSCI